MREKLWFRSFLVASTYLIVSYALDVGFIDGFEMSVKSFLWQFLKAAIVALIIIVTFGDKGRKRRRYKR